MDNEIIEQNGNQEAVSEEKSPKRRRGLRAAVNNLFLPVKKVFDDVESDFANSSHFKKTLIAMLKLRVWICVPLAIFVCVSACFFHYRNSYTATAEMSLNYEEAANGLNPNATRFNAYNIASREVVENMLRYCGINPESVDVNSLCDAITISSTNNKAFTEGDYYISTTFKVTLKKPAFVKGIRTPDLLNFLCKAYKDNLYYNFTENRSILDFNIDIFNDKEYLEIADLLDLKARQIEKYLNTRAKQNKAFVETETDETFKSLVQKVEDIKNYDIAKYRTFVIEAGCSYDKDRYIRSLSYTNMLNGISYNKDMTAYNVHNDGIKMYNDAMISVVMIPSIDESKRTYYMSKTKTGMDYLANRADNLLATAQETAKSITINQEIMAKMGAGANESDKIKKANQMIDDIRYKFSELSRQIETVDKAYVKYKTKDYLTFKPVKMSVIQKLRLDFIVELSAAFIVLVYGLVGLRFLFLKESVEK